MAVIVFGLADVAVNGFITVNRASVCHVCTDSSAALGWVVKGNPPAWGILSFYLLWGGFHRPFSFWSNFWGSLQMVRDWTYWDIFVLVKRD